MVDIPKDVWFHLRLVVAGAQARFFVKDMEKPVLVMDDLKSGIQKGQVALAVLIGATDARTSSSGQKPMHRGSGTCRRRLRAP